MAMPTAGYAYAFVILVMPTAGYAYAFVILAKTRYYETTRRVETYTFHTCVYTVED
ncbi:MAG: hypothetical protein V7K48_25815 [Nostoc sp.]|uniref:hypothetical protein n=1 Tax=Nostoc sp. TaxID=1180 RepID=UPI002FF9BF05